MSLKAPQIEGALRRTGAVLAARGIEGPIRLYLVGGSAGLLNGLIGAARMTADVDVMSMEPGEKWEWVRDAARTVAAELRLPETWLNDECRIFAWCLPLGWRGRCDRAIAAGPLEVRLISRGDFVAGRVVTAARRPADLEDLLALKPTRGELAFAEENVSRLEREHLGPEHGFDEARAILRVLRGER